jgi:hypothetical protein
MENLGDGGIHALTTFLTQLTGMKELVVDGIVHRPATKDKSNEQIEVCFEKMNDPEFVYLKHARFFLDHGIYRMYPSIEVGFQMIFPW